MNTDGDLLHDFIAESLDHLSTAEQDLLTLVRQGSEPDPELVNRVFRAIHSIKGCAGFFGQRIIGQLAHVMESVLLRLRNNEMTATQPMVDALLAGVDRLNALLHDAAHSNEADIGAVSQAVSAFLAPDDAAAPAAPPPTAPALQAADGRPLGITVSARDVAAVPADYSRWYRLSMDLQDMHRDHRQKPVALFHELAALGHVVEARLDEPAADLWASLPEGPLLATIIFATSLPDEALRRILHLKESELTVLARPETAPPPPAPPAEPDPGAEASETGPDEIPELTLTPEMRARFVQDADEMFAQAETALLEMEKSPDSRGENAHAAFRAIHSFKGNCGFMNLADLEEVAHSMENVLGAIQDGSLRPGKGDFATLLTIVDILRNAVTQFAATGDGSLPGRIGLRDLLQDIIRSAAAPAAPAAPAPAPQPAAQALPPPAPETPLPPAAPAEPQPAHAPQPPEPTARPASAAPLRQDVRVDLAKLDHLINLVGELVIAEDMVVRHPLLQGLEDETLERAIHHLRRISTDLQDVAMSVRMIPLSATFRKMIRLVHDVSHKAGKLARLDLVGEETEVDKTVIELISDPLVHLIRNSVDHGLEPPAARRAAGKPETGAITLEARHEGGEVWILIRDDGRGLDRGKILRKGLERGLVQGDGRDLADDDVFRLIFEPGFSTADKVTDISGRGVGMDVVKRNIEKLKGRVDVRNAPGQGLTVILRVPLTLAIIDGMLVRVGDAQYTIPLLSIRESLRADPSRITTTPDGQELVRVRDDLIPILRLHRLFRRAAALTALADGILVLVETGRQPLALFVDEIMGQQQTVIKGLSKYIGEARYVSGCTILGNGEVSLILDVGGLGRLAGGD